MNSNLNTPIYMHFLDRELRTSIKSNLSDDSILNIIEIALYSSINFLYVSNSLLFENILLFPKSIKLILYLEKLGFAHLLSNYPTIDEFVFSRQRLYLHDRERYPLYFKSTYRNMPWGKKINYIEDSTTDWLNQYLKTWLNSYPYNEDYLYLNKIFKDSQSEKIVKNIFEHSLEKRRDQAITYKLFSQMFPKLNKEIEHKIKSVISLTYTKRYLEILNGDLITGIIGLDYFDKLSINFPFLDYQIISSILRSLNIINCNDISEERINIAIEYKHKQLFRDFNIELRCFLNGIYTLLNIQNKYYLVGRNKILFKINSLFQKYLQTKSNKKDKDNFFNLFNLNQKLLNIEQGFKEGYNIMKKKLAERKKVLLVTSTFIEIKELINAAERSNYIVDKFTIGDHTFWNLGIIGDNEVFSFKTGMGSGGTTGSTLGIFEALDSINPDFVIQVGIAYGLSNDKQSIGDILVSRQILAYEKQKRSTRKIIPRGDKITASPLLIDRFEASSIKWSKCKIHFGLVLSGDKLVNSEVFRNELKRIEPEAIGGEMEGAGLIAACQKKKKDWILVKGIADLGMDKTDDFQKKSSFNAINYVLFTVENYLI